MSNEYINLKPFGFNVALPKESKAAKQAINNAMKDFFEPVIDYLEKNNEVFSGNVEKEIERISIQAMNVSFAIADGKTINKLDTKG